MQSQNDAEALLAQELARRTNTESRDWFLVLKARYGMGVVFKTLRDVRGAGNVVTQAFTCCTAIDPITDAGLDVCYADLQPDSLALDLSTVEVGERTLAVVLQHTFGLMDVAADAHLAQVAHDAGAIVVEDCAHCVCRLARDDEDKPLADISIHSFGMEKMLQNSYFGGAVWVSPALGEDLRARLIAALASLRVPNKKFDRAIRSYRNQMRVLTRVPAGLSRGLKSAITNAGLHEPGITDDELRGRLPLQPMRPTPWLCQHIMEVLGQLESSVPQRIQAVRVYQEAFRAAAARGNAAALPPAQLLNATDVQPLLRYPIVFSTSCEADECIAKVGAMGFYSVPWYRPLLFPGVLDAAAYGWGPEQEKTHPKTIALSRGIACLPTDVTSEQASRIAQMVLGEVTELERGQRSEEGRMRPTITTEQDVRERLVPVILGGDILGYSCVREFHRAYGINSIILSAVNVRSTSASKFCDYRIVPNIGDEEVCVAYLSKLGRELSAQGKVGLALGCADWHARILSAHKEELGEWYVVPYIDFDLLDDITKKERFYAICEELGIDYPHTWYLDCADQDAQLDTSQFPYPLIAKPSNSASYDLLEFHGKKKIYEIETPEELAHVYDIVRASGYPHKLVVQDFIPGEDDAIRSLTLYANEDGKTCVAAGGQVVLQDHSPLALGNPVCILSEKVDKIVEDGKRFLEHVGYHGYANFDIKYDERDGSYRFFEVNTRMGRNTYYISLGGVNFVTPIVEDWVLGRDLPYREAYDPYVYTVIPAKVVRKTVKDPDLRKRVLDMYRKRLAKSPLFYAADTIEHRVWARLTWRHQVAKFKKFVWDTGGKQASVE
ncbi:MAG: DegT/DnrJ/EryC1/StrS family aminotransferase [Atopobiaceae bacterium]|nr:DegT/DnrJ/EryC1/StrS family aminotransferase [Atopobiaceae bacterium]